MRKYKINFVPIKTWNPTKIFAWEECGFRAQLRYGFKLCPLCFRGQFTFDGPCTACGKRAPKSEAQARGIRLDDSLHKHFTKNYDLDLEGSSQHPEVQKTLKKLGKTAPLNRENILFKHSISLGPDWKPLPKFTKGPWFWGELDVLKVFRKLAEVLDWKSGGVDKKREVGKPYPNKNYQDQLEIYGVAVLSAMPEVVQAKSSLVFLDAKPPHDPVVEGPVVTRKSLPVLQKRWEQRVAPMLNDDVFAPRPGDPYCGWCDYSKAKGGPCKY